MHCAFHCMSASVIVRIAKGEVESEILNTYRGSQKFQSGMKLKSYGKAIHYLNDAEVYYVIIIHAGPSHYRYEFHYQPERRQRVTAICLCVCVCLCVPS